MSSTPRRVARTIVAKAGNVVVSKELFRGIPKGDVNFFLEALFVIRLFAKFYGVTLEDMPAFAFI
jgi:hypothetical protein